jgi:hypothetical protein
MKLPYAIKQDGTLIEDLYEGPSFHYCNGNLKELHLTDVSKFVSCSGNKIEKLTIPNNLLFLACDKGVIDITTCKVPDLIIYY